MGETPTLLDYGCGEEALRQCMVIVCLEGNGDSAACVNQTTLHGEDPLVRWLVESVENFPSRWAGQNRSCAASE